MMSVIGFIGAGNMAKAIGLRLISEGEVKPSNVIVSAKSERNFDVWKAIGVQTTNSNAEVVEKANLIFIAVKPQYFEEAVNTIDTSGNNFSKTPRIFVSVMAGKRINYIERVLKTSLESIPFDVIRVMPNTPCIIGSGCSALCHAPGVKPQYLDQVVKLIQCTGTCDVIPEEMFDSVAALSGCGPAFIYVIIEALADGAVRCGVPRDLSLKLAAQMVSGSAQMVTETKKHPGQLKDEVCSPGGTTIAGVYELEKGGIRSIFMNAIQASANKGYELSKSAPGK